MKIKDILSIVISILLVITSWLLIYAISEYFWGYDITIIIMNVNLLLGVMTGFAIGIRYYCGGAAIPGFLVLGAIAGFIGAILVMTFLNLYLDEEEEKE